MRGDDVTTLSERDRIRALVVLAASCGASRVAMVVESRLRYLDLRGSLYPIDLSHWLPVVGACLGAILIHWRGPRATAIAAAAVSAVGAVMGALHLAALDTFLTVLGSGMLTVGAFAFAARLLVPEGEPPSPSRFAGMAGFVLARAAAMELGSYAWWSWSADTPPAIAHEIAATFHIAALVGIVRALPRAQARSDAAPAQPPYRAPSPLDVPPIASAATPSSVGVAWRALRPFVVPAVTFTLGAVGAARHMSRSASGLLGGLVAAGAALYFFLAWRRRSAASPFTLYARGLMLTAGGWLLLAVGAFAGGVTGHASTIPIALGSSVASLALGFAALAGRGRGHSDRGLDGAHDARERGRQLAHDAGDPGDRRALRPLHGAGHPAPRGREPLLLRLPVGEPSRSHRRRSRLRSLEGDVDVVAGLTLEAGRDGLEERDDLRGPGRLVLAEGLEVASDLLELDTARVVDPEEVGRLREELLLLLVDVVVHAAQPGGRDVHEGLVLRAQGVDEELFHRERLLEERVDAVAELLREVEDAGGRAHAFLLVLLEAPVRPRHRDEERESFDARITADRQALHGAGAYPAGL